MGSSCNIFVLFKLGLCICISQVVKFYVSKLWSSEAKEKVKMASGGMVLIKYLLFFFNFIFWVSIFLVTWPLLQTNECCTFLEAVKLMHNTPYAWRLCKSRLRAYRGIESGSESVYMYLADKFNVFSQTNFAPLRTKPISMSSKHVQNIWKPHQSISEELRVYWSWSKMCHRLSKLRWRTNFEWNRIYLSVFDAPTFQGSVA